jgi:hypothetical protein
MTQFTEYVVDAVEEADVEAQDNIAKGTRKRE